MKTWKLYTVIGILAILAGVFIGCPTPDGGNKNQTPTVTDFDISGTGTFTYDGSPKTVTVTAKQGKTSGAITVKYNGSATAPSTVGAYTVTFDVAEATGWNEANGLNAGTIMISFILIADINDLSGYLSSKPANTKNTPYFIALNINDEDDFVPLQTTLNSAEDKNVYLDLSGSTITTIPDFAFCDSWEFTGCITLTGITIPNTVTSIGECAFYGCNNLTSVTIPNSVTSIEDAAFYECTSLTSITIPSSVTNIGLIPFAFCTNLTEIKVDVNNTVYTSENGILYNRGKTVLTIYPAGKIDTSFSIPNNVSNIGEYAFYTCKNLTNVTIPDSITNIGQQTFMSCTSLTSITIPNSIESIGNMAFGGCTNLGSIKIPNNVKSIGSGAFQECTNLASVTFQGTITSDNFHTYAFYLQGDLRTKFYATDPVNGTPGTYTTTTLVSATSVWEKQ